MLTIAKIGGQLIEDPSLLQKALRDFHRLEGPKILVHGGGKRASQLLQQMGIVPRMLDGRRLTDAATLEVVTMVYAGLINKNIVAQLQALGCQSLGLCGADMDSIRAHKRVGGEVDYGFVGDVDQIHATAIHGLLQSGISPVFCAITHDGAGQLLNTNADTIAAQLAIGLAQEMAVRLCFCFEHIGVLEDPNNPQSVLSQLNRTTYEAHKIAGVISAGMIPKIDNALHALQQGVQQVKICSIDGILHPTGTHILNSL
ncbi:MAG: acetylglutamate kinase [Bacteroidota bacterium]